MNQKLIMEGWRSFLAEDARNQEAGILTAAFMKVLTNITRSSYDFSKKTNTSVSLESVAMELAAVEQDIKNYIKKSGAKKSKFLNTIQNFNVETKVKDSNKPFAFTITGGGINGETKNFTIKITISGKFDSSSIGNNMRWVDRAKLSLQELSQHELEHIAQGLSGGNVTSDAISGNIAGGKDSRTLMGKIKDFLFKPKNKSEFAKQLKDAKDTINYLNKNSKKGAVEIITYYTQPAEIEAYTVGMVRRAKISASNMIKQDNSKRSVKNELIQDEFFKLFDNHTNSMLNTIDSNLQDEYKEDLKKYVEQISDKMIDYAFERYGFLRQ